MPHPNTSTGTMGSAILSGVLAACAKTRAAGDEPRVSRFIATVNSAGSAEGLRSRFSEYSDCFEVLQSGNVKAMQEADIVLLAFKPYMIDLVLAKEGVREALVGKLVISVLVGSPPRKIEAAIFHAGLRQSDEAFYFKRAMPSIAAEFGESMTVIETTAMPKEFQEVSEWIFLQCGKIAPVAPEQFDIGGVMGAASIAMLSVAFDGMLDGAVSQGLKRADGKKLLTQALFSMAKLFENGEHPAVLREKFSSPKGTTIDGLLSLEEDRVRYAFSKATIATSKRSQEIGK
jgi:pyrroline-5-carboxylate reductase